MFSAGCGSAVQHIRYTGLIFNLVSTNTLGNLETASPCSYLGQNSRFQSFLLFGPCISAYSVKILDEQFHATKCGFLILLSLMRIHHRIFLVKAYIYPCYLEGKIRPGCGTQVDSFRPGQSNFIILPTMSGLPLG